MKRWVWVGVVLSLGLAVAGCKRPRHRDDGGGGNAGTTTSTSSPRRTKTFTNTEVKISALPTGVEEFVSLRDQVADSPAGGAAMFVVALYLHTQDRALGLQCLTVAVDRNQLTEGREGYKGLQPARRCIQNWRDRVLSKPYIAASYFLGTSPGGKYALPAPPFVIGFKEVRNPYQKEGQAKCFVYSSGADSARPITLIRNNRG